MRFSHMAAIYFMMGIVVVGTGAVPLAHIGIAGAFVDVSDTGDVETNTSAVGGDEDATGMMDNLIGPVKNALNTITGGALLAVWGPISTLTAFYAWPMVTVNYLGAPMIVKLMAGVLVMSFTFGVFRVFRASI